MADAQQDNASTSRATAATGTSSSAAEAQLRNRLSRARLSRPSPQPSPIRRRSSLRSYTSLEDATASFHDDIIQPSSSRRKAQRDHEITHWASTPLAFAILPAISGLLFTDGSAFVTDALLLALAAVFMNWSIRVPREWYHSAQAVRREVEDDFPDVPLSGAVDESAIVEEDEDEDNNTGGTPKAPASPAEEQETEQPPPRMTVRDEAAAQLRRQETLALVATFVFPAGAAYLLHVIRSQLSRPSTSLVSDYNLSIFLLAAEFWPARQVIRLVTARTLHLQRVASGLNDPFSEPLATDGPDRAGLFSRIETLEAQLSGQALVPDSTKLLQHADLAGLDAKIQKRLEPRLDSLERAVRRYEKRYTTLALVTEQRFQSLETRLQDALSLAAVAAQHSQTGSGIVKSALGTMSDIVVLPAKLAWELVSWPFKVLDELFARVKILLLGPQSANQAGKRKPARHSVELKLREDKLAKERLAKKVVR